VHAWPAHSGTAGVLTHLGHIVTGKYHVGV
jgi:hypothetical protein